MPLPGRIRVFLYRIKSGGGVMRLMASEWLNTTLMRR